MQIKTYNANKFSKLIDMQINTIKKHFIILCEKNSRIHVTSKMITNDTTALIIL